MFGKQHFYLKNSATIEEMAHINSIVFDKTGTLTAQNKLKIEYNGKPLDWEEKNMLKSVVRNSVHPLSKELSQFFAEQETFPVSNFEETPGQGIKAIVNNIEVMIGSANFVGIEPENRPGAQTHVKMNNQYLGCYFFTPKYRAGMAPMLAHLNKKYETWLLSGDNDLDKPHLSQFFKTGTLRFNQKPEDKSAFVNDLKKQNKQVLMLGDGINDAGAISAANVGIAITEDVFQFTPSSKAILKASQLHLLPWFLQQAHKSIIIVRLSIAISLLYNLLGIYFALTGKLTPLLAAIFNARQLRYGCGFCYANHFVCGCKKTYNEGRP
ncbi:MAG: HAD-IC family P-type ATPase [Bacteroidales bacterium]|nr:HAD-IC family P-type ATPase [Bacteroidales bacterium]